MHVLISFIYSLLHVGFKGRQYIFRPLFFLLVILRLFSPPMIVFLHLLLTQSFLVIDSKDFVWDFITVLLINNIISYQYYQHNNIINNIISFIIFWDLFYRIFLSPQVKRWAIITYPHGIYILPPELLNDLRLGDLTKLGNIKKVPRPHRMIAQCPVPPLPPPLKWKLC